MNKLLIITILVTSMPLMAMSKTFKLNDVKEISTPKTTEEVKAGYDMLYNAVKELEKNPSDELAVAILKGYAAVGKKDPSYIGIEDLAPYFKKNSKKMTELAKKNLDKKESEVMLMALESMAENVGRGNDPSVEK